MISKKMLESLNTQLNKELYSAYLYLGMAGYAMSEGFAGVANWFYVQMKEEMTHAEKFFQYICHQNGEVRLEKIDKPDSDFSSPADLFTKTLEHEQIVTKSIHSLVTQARKESDHATDAFLQWFVTEQVEEEANANEMIQKLKIVGKDGNGLLTLDNQLAARVFVPPAASAGPAGN